MTKDQKQQYEENRPWLLLAVGAIYGTKPGPFSPDIDLGQAERFLKEFERRMGITK